MGELVDQPTLSSGSTLLNLACSGSPAYAAVGGRYYWMVGDSSSGKTFLTLTFLAEASVNPAFDRYRLIYDNVEDGALMDVEKYFGPKLAARLEPPSGTAADPVYSREVNDFYFHVDDANRAAKKRGGRPFIYLLDSMDALDTEYAEKKFNEHKTAARKGKTAAGDYGDGKAKINSTHLRRVVADLRDTGSILIVLSQTRDNVGGGMFDPAKTHAGGHALKFYATWQLWSSLGATLKKKINDNERQIGVTSRIRLKKNRLTGREWSVEIPIYWSIGIDDIGSCVDYLIDEKHWKVEDGVIWADDLGFSGKRAALIDHIEENDLETDLRATVAEVWREIVEQCTVARKPRYT